MATVFILFILKLVRDVGRLHSDEASFFIMISEVNFNFQGEDEGDGDDDNGDDDGFFVPHGYLSDDEGVEDGDEDGDDDECDVNEEKKVLDLLLPVVITYFYTTTKINLGVLQY